MQPLQNKNRKTLVTTISRLNDFLDRFSIARHRHPVICVLLQLKGAKPMSAATTQTVSTLTPDDLKSLADSFITSEIAEAAGIFRVDSVEGAAKVGQLNKKNVPRRDCAGLSFQYRPVRP